MNTEKMKKRYAPIDALKGWLMILVIWSHTYAGNVEWAKYVVAGYMGAFFCVAGFTIKDTCEKSYIDFVSKKAKRLLLPYLGYGVFLISIFWSVQIIKHEISLDIIIRCLFGFAYNAFMVDKQSGYFLLICYNNTFWFLTVMFIAVLIVELYKKMHELRKTYGIIAFLIVLMFAIILNSNTRYMLPWGIDTAFLAAILIIVGNEIKKTIEKVEHHRGVYAWFPVYIIICVAIYMQIVYYSDFNMATKEYGENTIGVFLFLIISVLYALISITIFIALNKLGFDFKYLCWIGQNTIPFMMLQMITIRFLEKALSKVIKLQLLVGYITLIGVVIFLSIGIVLYKFLIKVWGHYGDYSDWNNRSRK